MLCHIPAWLEASLERAARLKWAEAERVTTVRTAETRLAVASSVGSRVLATAREAAAAAGEVVATA